MLAPGRSSLLRIWAGGLFLGISNLEPQPNAAMSTAALRRFARDDSGIAVTEYGLLIALVAVLLIGVVTIFGSSIASWFANKTNKITSF